MNIDLTGKTILVTGGTSTLGSEIVSCLVAEKATVFFTYFENESRANDLHSLGARAIQADLRKIEDLDRVKETLKKESPSLDGLVHNAAGVRDHTVSNLTDEEFDEVLDLDLTAVFRLTKRFLPLLYKKEGGKIVNIISRAGTHGGFGEANYAAAKAGLAAFTKTLAWEVGRKKICVNAVAPGFMMSRMTQNLPEFVYAKHKQDSCFDSYTEPAEVAHFVLYLLSDLTKGITGQIFYIDSRKTKIF